MAHFNMTSTVALELQVDSEPCGTLAITMVAVSLFMWFLFPSSLFTGQMRIYILSDRQLYH